MTVWVAPVSRMPHVSWVAKSTSAIALETLGTGLFGSFTLGAVVLSKIDGLWPVGHNRLNFTALETGFLYTVRLKLGGSADASI